MQSNFNKSWSIRQQNKGARWKELSSWKQTKWIRDGYITKNKLIHKLTSGDIGFHDGESKLGGINLLN